MSKPLIHSCYYKKCLPFGTFKVKIKVKMKYIKQNSPVLVSFFRGLVCVCLSMT